MAEPATKGKSYWRSYSNGVELIVPTAVDQGFGRVLAYIRTESCQGASILKPDGAWASVVLPPGLSLEEVKLHIEALLALEN